MFHCGSHGKMPMYIILSPVVGRMLKTYRLEELIFQLLGWFSLLRSRYLEGTMCVNRGYIRLSLTEAW